MNPLNSGFTSFCRGAAIHAVPAAVRQKMRKLAGCRRDSYPRRPGSPPGTAYKKTTESVESHRWPEFQDDMS